MFSWLNKIVDAAGRMFGAAEIDVHHPLVPVKSYVSEVATGLWRGSWPSKETLAELKTKGVGVVINLCAERCQNSLVRSLNLAPINIPIVDNTVPTDEQVIDFISVATASQVGCYVHCEEGDGRTGCMIAAYRILCQHWQPETALQEAESYHLAMPCQKEFILSLKL